VDVIVCQHEFGDFSAGKVGLKGSLRILLEFAFQPAADYESEDREDDND
jgi:hypothetical protein